MVQPDGQLVVAGSTTVKTDMAVTRLNPDGSPDTSFDGDGTSRADFGSYDSGYAAALQPDGKIVIAGYTTVTSNGHYDFAVARFNPSGPADTTLDETFDGDGKKTFGYGGDDAARAVLAQADGKLVLAGYIP